MTVTTMPSKRAVFVLVVIAALGLLAVKMLRGNAEVAEIVAPYSYNVDIEVAGEQLRWVSNRRLLVEQRNNLSRLLNLKQQRIGQLECERVANENVATSDTGGWCAQASKEDGGQYVTDKKLAAAYAEFLSGKFIGSFGDGPGRYKQLVKDSGKVKDYHAYDGAPFCEKTSEGRVQFLDLTLPQYGLPLYDWIISMEVAEHIPQQFESIYINNLVRHAKEGVILSWARPGQVGYSHVNNRPFEYVKSLMEGLGFSHDLPSSEKLRGSVDSKFINLRRNINVFRRRNIDLQDLLLNI